MYLSYPVLEYHLSCVAAKRLIDKYNKDQENAMKLKSSHFRLVELLLGMVHKRIFDRNKIYAENEILRKIKSDDLIFVSTNNLELSNRYCSLSKKINKSTIYRILDRMGSAGLIVGRKWHGTNHNYEIALTPDICIFFDQNNPKNHSQSKFLEDAEIKARKEHKNAKSIEFLNLKSESNNKIIACSHVDKLAGIHIVKTTQLTKKPIFVEITENQEEILSKVETTKKLKPLEAQKPNCGIELLEQNEKEQPNTEIACAENSNTEKPLSLAIRDYKVVQVSKIYSHLAN